MRIHRYVVLVILLFLTVLALVIGLIFHEQGQPAVTEQDPYGLGPTLTLFINEVMSSNGSILADGDGDFSDWVELFNPGLEPYDLTGYYLTDDLDNRMKWQFSKGTVPARGFLLVFASSKDEKGPAGEIHTNFSIAASGEPVVLVAPDGKTVVDYMPEVLIPRDTTYGKDMHLQWRYLRVPTPGTTNSQ